MLATHPVGYLRFLISIAALGLLAALLLLPAPVRAQAMPMITGDATAIVAENTATSEVIKTYTATDLDSDPLTWSLEGDDAGDFTIVGGELKFVSVPNFEAPADMGTNNVYNVTVKVADDETTPMMDTLAVTVTVTNVNEMPMITSGATNVTKPEQTPTSEILSTYAATDPDASTTFTWTLTGTDAGDFVITKNSTTMGGELKFRNEPNFESPADQGDDNNYDVTVNVSDGSLIAMRDVTITVTDVNEAPVITTTGSTYATISVPENTSTADILATYEADDPEGNALTWTKSGDDAGEFTITRNSSGHGELKFSTVPDYENAADNDGNNVYNVTVNVKDTNGSAVDASILVTVTVTNVNEAPVITTTTDSTHKNFSVPENTSTSEILATYQADDPEGGTLTWTLGGDDEGDFTITRNSSGHGELKFSAVPDYEVPADNGTNNIYNVTVNVKDTNGSAVDDSILVAVTVTNVDEAGTATFTGTLSGGSTQTAGLTDPDGSTTSKTYRWQRSGMANSGFANINLNDTSETYVPVAMDVGKWLRVRVSYTDGQGSGKSATSASRGPIGASNSEPTFS